MTLEQIKEIRIQQWSESKQGIDLYFLEITDIPKDSSNSVHVALTNYGARLISIYTPVNEHEYNDILIGGKTYDQIRNGSLPVAGAVIGRFANRIEYGSFELNGKRYQLDLNLPPHHIHGGDNGFQNCIWNVKSKTQNSIQFQLYSPSGSSGYPGNLTCRVTYSLAEGNKLKINYEASTDQPTIINLTNHAYFNLSGDKRNPIDDYNLKIASDFYTPVNELIIPTGEIASVRHTPFDFRNPIPISEHIKESHEQLAYGHGYDHNFVLNKSTNSFSEFASSVFDPVSKRIMKVFTSEPGLQFFTTNVGTVKEKTDPASDFMDQKIINAFCLETQHFPDSPNNKHFPTTKLEPGELFHSETVYQFDF